MATKTVTVHVCGCCDREHSYAYSINKCEVCGGECCYYCTERISGSVYDADICRNCYKDEKVVKVYKEYGKKFISLIKERAEAAKKVAKE